MVKRSECKCICHTDAYVLGKSPIIKHTKPCCEPDDNLIVSNNYNKNSGKTVFGANNRKTPFGTRNR